MEIDQRVLLGLVASLIVFVLSFLAKALGVAEWDSLGASHLRVFAQVEH